MNDEARSKPLIFISHAGADAEVAQILQDFLDRLFLGGLRFFNTSDRDLLSPGEHWLDRIQESLVEADVLLAIATANGMRSSWVNFECGAAWLGDADVVPCAAGSTPKDALPAPYNQIQSVNLHDPLDLASLVRRVATPTGLTVPEADYETVAAALQLAAAESASAGIVDMTALGARRDSRVEVEWRYRRSSKSPDRLAATYQVKLEFEVIERELGLIEFLFTPGTELVQFSRDEPPLAELLDSETPKGTSVKLLPAFASSGSKFAFNARFDPPLRLGQRARLEVRIDFDPYRAMYLDALLAELKRTRSAVREHDSSSRTLSQPCDHFIYRVLLPAELDLTPMLPEAMRNGVEFLEEQELIRHQPGMFSIDDVEIDGEQFRLMEIVRKNPPYNTKYRLRWRLPWKPDEVP